MLGLEKRIQVESGVALAAEKDTETTASRMGFAVAIAVILILAVGYVVIDTKLSTERALAAINEKAADMDRRVTKLEELPGKVRKTIVTGYLSEVAQKVAYAGDVLESPEQKELAKKITDMVNQLKADVNK